MLHPSSRRWLSRCATMASVVATLSVATGCHTMKFNVSDEARSTHPVHHKKFFYLWGLAPTHRVDVAERCPYGTRSVKEETTFIDGVIGLVTLGLVDPRSSTYLCYDEPAASAEKPS